MLATGHGKAVRTAAGPAQPPSRILRERRQARGGKQHGSRTFGAERFTAGVGRRGEISARKPFGREPARHACPKGWASCEERAAESSVAADVGQTFILDKRFGTAAVRTGEAGRQHSRFVGRRDENVNDARPKRARLDAGTVPIAHYPQAAVRDGIGSPTLPRQQRGALDVGPRWCGCRYTMEDAAACKHETFGQRLR